MINFFRKIRKKLADDNKPLKYIRYAIGEIVLVVIGILIALQINDWDNSKKNQLQTAMYLENLHTELKEEVSSLEERLDDLDYNISLLNIILSSLNANRDSLDEAKLNENITHVFANRPRQSYNSVYQDLISTGNLSLIEASKRKQIIKYYTEEAWYTTHSNQEYKYNWEVLLPFFNRSGIFKWENKWPGEGVQNIQKDDRFILLDYSRTDPIYIEAKNGLYFRKVMQLNYYDFTKRRLEAAQELLETLK